VSPTTGERRTGAKAILKRQSILDAAAEVLAARGYSGTTLTEVAELAGTQPGSLYYHFESREALITEVLLKGISAVNDHVVSVVKALPKSAPPADRLEAAIRGHLDIVLDRSAYALSRSSAMHTVVISRSCLLRQNSQAVFTPVQTSVCCASWWSARRTGRRSGTAPVAGPLRLT
jgi:AcrR family transcriptional regulator